MLEIENKF